MGGTVDCVCVCVFITLTDRAPTFYSNPPRKNKMLLPIRSVVSRTGGEKGIKPPKNGAPQGYKLQKTNAKTIPPVSEIRNISNPVGEKNNTNQKQKQKSKRDDNRHERTRVETGGQVKTLYSL